METYIFGICTLSASFCLPKSCHGLERVDTCPNGVVGLFCPGCAPIDLCILLTDTGILPLFASSNVAGWHNSV